MAIIGRASSLKTAETTLALPRSTSPSHTPITPRLIDMKARDPRRAVFGDVMAHHVFGGLVDIDRLHPQVRAPLEVVLEDAGDRCDLSGGERIKRVADRETGSDRAKHLRFSKASDHSSG